MGFTDYNISQTWLKKLWHILLLTLCMLMLIPDGRAHEGPPFAIIVDEEVGPYLVSVWTDPDIGIGTFYIIFDPKNDGELPDINSVEVGVKPTSGRLDEVLYTAETQRSRNGARYYSEVQFDKGEMWKVRVLIEGNGWDGELTSEVEATPDGGVGPIAVVIYALPFIGIGIIWIRVIIRRRENE
ncbi:MAG: hypothetical protein U5K69_09835 [Balneolaceae bacterium]|nr:hypothetical protein [Balneolaceae bacterium]